MLALREPVMSNPNNCTACDHKRHPDGGWCYMFRAEPQATCLQHTMRRDMTAAEAIEDLAAMRRRGQAWVRGEPPNVRANRTYTAR